MATTRINTYPADVVYETALNAGPLQSSPPPWWTSFTPYVLGKWDTAHGRNAELDRNETGTWKPALDNRVGAFDPGNPAGPFYPQLAPYNPLRLRMPFGVNRLTADQAAAGQQSGFLGAIPPRMNVLNDAGYPLSIVTSGSAFTGTQVYQAVLPNGAASGATVLLLKAIPVVPGRAFSCQAQAQITAGNSVSTNLTVQWYGQGGTALGTVTGAAQTLTSGAGTWTQLAASGTAPAGAFSAWLKVEIASGTLTASTTWQVDGLQVEQSATPTPYQTPQTLGVNLLPRVIATGSASMDPVHDAVGNWFYPAQGTIAQANYLATPAPPGQTTAVAWTLPSGSSGGAPGNPLYLGPPSGTASRTVLTDNVQVTAGQTYTASFYLTRSAGGDATVTMAVGIQWYGANGLQISAGVGAAVTVTSAGWVRATSSTAAPAGALWGTVSVYLITPGTTTAQNVIYVAAPQFEQAGAASTWVDPGPTLFAFTGAWEQFPQKWRLSGTWGESDAVGVDALAGLAQFTVTQPFLHEVQAMGPNWFYTLSDAAGSTTFADLTGKKQAAPIRTASPYGAGTVTPGNGITSSSSPLGAFIGTAGPITTITNPNFGSNNGGAGSAIDLFAGGVPGPPGVGSAWTRMIAFRCSTVPSGSQFATLWWTGAPFGPLYSNNSQAQAGFIVGGNLQVLIGGPPAETPTQITFSGNWCDGNWHLLMFGLSADGKTMYAWADGTPASTASLFGDDIHPTSVVFDMLGSLMRLPQSQAAFENYSGDVAFAAEFGFLLTNAQITNLYNSWRSASQGESSGARMKRLLVSWFGYSGATAIDTGSTVSMGPASDLAGQSALNAAFAIATTENGNLFASNAGVLTFKARSALYNSSPVFVFGEQQQWGEWPCEDVQLPTDPLLTYNIIPTQQYSTGQVATAQDLSSQNANYPRTLPQRVINSTSFAEVQAAGQYLLGQYHKPRQRLASMTLHPAAVPGLFLVCAQLELGTRIRAMVRPPWRATSAPIQFDGFVQRVEWSLNPVGGDATVRVEASPADLQSYWTLAPLHTTLNAQAASGQNQATINALPDAAVNKLASSLPQGYQLLFEPGTPRAEVMTLSPTGIPATSVGYSTAVLTFTSNFQFTHGPNSVVCEPLPTGYTDPTAWDANSVLGAASTTVLSGGTSGTNTVTVGPLADAAVNPLGSNWNEGDTIWLSPGTANFESATILSVAATVPGYTSCQITLAANLAHTHALGDTVCDPLPAGVTNPSAVAATARLAY